MFSRNRVIEFTISNDTLLSKQLNWDLTDRNPEELPGISFINKKVRANDNVYFYLRDSRDTLHSYGLNTFRVIERNKTIILAINSPDSSFADTNSVSQYILKDTGGKYGLTLYSENEIHKLQKQKNIRLMTAKDFKLYANKLLEARSVVDSLSKISGASSGLLYYGYSMLRNIFGQIGYNPLFTGDEFDTLIKRFENDPETKATWQKIAK